MAKKPKVGKTPILGGKKDGARPSVKHQVSGHTKGNPSKPMQSSRTARIGKMEKMDPAC